jgi:hypothetical protein
MSMGKHVGTGGNGQDATMHAGFGRAGYCEGPIGLKFLCGGGRPDRASEAVSLVCCLSGLYLVRGRGEVRILESPS